MNKAMYKTFMTPNGPVQVVIKSSVGASKGYRLHFPPRGLYRIKFPDTIPLKFRFARAKNKLESKSAQLLTSGKPRRYNGFTVGSFVEVKTKTETFTALFIGVDRNLEETRAVLQLLTRDYEYVLPFKRIVREVKL